MSNPEDGNDARERTVEEENEPEAVAESRGASKTSEGDETASPAKRPATKRRADASSKATRVTSGGASGRLALAAALILAAGGAGGWFAHEAHAKSLLRQQAAAGGERGACGAWEQKICESSGEGSPGCQQAKSATDLMTQPTCEVALQTVPATLSKMKAARASCDGLVGKLCKDLPPGSPACDFVKQQTPAFPPSRCDAMLEQYDKVLQELQMLEQQMGQRGGMGMPPGHAPPGAGPHAPPGAHPNAPPGAVPQGPMAPAR